MGTLAGALSEPELARLRAALEFAAQHYGAARRTDGSTALEHVLAVTENLRAAGVRDADLLAAGILHDVIEQAPYTSSEIEAHFGPQVASLVQAVTCGPGVSAEESLRQALEHSHEALLLRLCDRLDGVRRSKGRKPADRQRFLDQTRSAHLPIARRIFPRLAVELEEALRIAEGADRADTRTREPE